jgi:hypothetical protein
MEETGSSEQSALFNENSGVAAHPYGTFQFTTPDYKLKTLRLARYSLYDLLCLQSTERKSNLADKNLQLLTAVVFVAFDVTSCVVGKVSFSNTKGQFTADTTKFISLLFVSMFRLW